MLTERRTVLAALLLLGVFVCGAVAGGLVVMLLHTSPLEGEVGAEPGARRRVGGPDARPRGPFPPGPPPPPPGSGGPPPERVVEHLRQAIDLTDEQEVAVLRILHAAHDQNRALMDQVHPQARAVLEKARADIRALLSPTQQKKFDAMPPPPMRRGPPPGRPGRGPPPF